MNAFKRPSRHLSGFLLYNVILTLKHVKTTLKHSIDAPDALYYWRYIRVKSRYIDVNTTWYSSLLVLSFSFIFYSFFSWLFFCTLTRIVRFVGQRLFFDAVIPLLWKTKRKLRRKLLGLARCIESVCLPRPIQFCVITTHTTFLHTLIADIPCVLQTSNALSIPTRSAVFYSCVPARKQAIPPHVRLLSVLSPLGHRYMNHSRFDLTAAWIGVMQYW